MRIVQSSVFSRFNPAVADGFIRRAHRNLKRTISAETVARTVIESQNAVFFQNAAFACGVGDFVFTAKRNG